MDDQLVDDHLAQSDSHPTLSKNFIHLRIVIGLLSILYGVILAYYSFLNIKQSLLIRSSDYEGFQLYYKQFYLAELAVITASIIAVLGGFLFLLKTRLGWLMLLTTYLIQFTTLFLLVIIFNGRTSFMIYITLGGLALMLTALLSRPYKNFYRPTRTSNTIVICCLVLSLSYVLWVRYLY